ncbi:hypothetical protein D0862_04150 [Hortaea werneckii]|uniref:Mid2 domain-containing protein n=1 Tax=Hortaea werneckii TaxID=91943 RepID=A0A3M7H410_HORWE|nr:hypothetical protein D0862_04150 [Hortaea werneckii]
MNSAAALFWVAIVVSYLGKVGYTLFPRLSVLFLLLRFPVEATTMARLSLLILLAGLGGIEIQDALAQRFPTDITATSVSTSSAASTITTTQDSSTTSLSIAGVSTPSANSASETDSLSSTSTPSISLSSIAAEASNTAINSTLTEDVKSNGSGLSSSAKVGVGVGVGIGVPLLAAILTAIVLIRKRRKRSLGPYGPVTTSDKGVGESSSFHSPSITPHELRNVSSKAPFLPPIAAQETSLRSTDQELSPSAVQNEPPSPIVPVRHNNSYQRPTTSQDISRSSTLKLHTRPATAPQQPSATSENLPPSPVSPVSPVSPISAASSRPSSLRRSSNYER